MVAISAFLALVPGRAVSIGQTADQAGMDQAANSRRECGVTTYRGLDSRSIFCARREMVGQEAAAVLFGEEAVKAPEAFLSGPDVEQVDHQEIAGLGALTPIGPDRKCTIDRSMSRTSSADRCS